MDKSEFACKVSLNMASNKWYRDKIGESHNLFWQVKRNLYEIVPLINADELTLDA